MSKWSFSSVTHHRCEWEDMAIMPLHAQAAGFMPAEGREQKYTNNYPQNIVKNITIFNGRPGGIPQNRGRNLTQDVTIEIDEHFKDFDIFEKRNIQYHTKYQFAKRNPTITLEFRDFLKPEKIRTLLSTLHQITPFSDEAKTALIKFINPDVNVKDLETLKANMFNQFCPLPSLFNLALDTCNKEKINVPFYKKDNIALSPIL